MSLLDGARHPVLATLTDATETAGSPDSTLTVQHPCPIVLLQRTAVFQIELPLYAERSIAGLEPPKFLVKRRDKEDLAAAAGAVIAAAVAVGGVQR